MTIQLIKGHFNSKDAIDIITKMIFVKIKFHEGKINAQSNEEDIKVHEKRIIELQHGLYEVRKQIEQKGTLTDMDATIEIS